MGSTDLNANDNDPSPRYDRKDTNHHGTRYGSMPLSMVFIHTQCGHWQALFSTGQDEFQVLCFYPVECIDSTIHVLGS